MSIKVNLNTIWVISILLLVIIILSGIKICDSPVTIKITSNPLFVDKPYNYISEPFADTPAPGTTDTPAPSTTDTPAPSTTDTPVPTIDFLSSINNLAKDKYEKTLAQTIELSKQNNQLGLLTRQIEALENKIKVLQQY